MTFEPAETETHEAPAATGVDDRPLCEGILALTQLWLATDPDFEAATSLVWRFLTLVERR